MGTPTSSITSPEFHRLLDQCIHCGLCLSACPTYTVLGTEMDSPRGRIALMRAAADGRIGLDGAFQEHIELCLGCRACETACPSGVRYGLLFETTRSAIEQQRTPGRMERLLRRVALAGMMPHRTRLRLLARALTVAQALGLPQFAQHMRALPAGLRSMAAILPPLDGAFPDYRKPAPAIGEMRGNVAFLVGCVQDAFLGRVNAATVRVLQRNGYTVHFPRQQSCCGAAALHSGEDGLARTLARRNIDACSGRDYDAIISNAGGCGAILKEYAHLLADDPEYAPRAVRFVGKLKDINEFLVDHLHRPPTGVLPVRATYMDSCHLRHAQKIHAAPRQLLAAIPGLSLVELQQPDMCCGSAGLYNIVQSETAESVLDAKISDIAATTAQVIVTANTGCHMQMIHGVAKHGLPAEVVHVMELLDRSYAQEAQAKDAYGHQHA